MDNQELQELVRRLSLKSFQRPFLHQAYFNARLRSTGGRYLLQSHNIEINPKAYELYGLEEVQGIILHELCHYHLHIEGKGYQHRDKDFRELLRKVDAPLDFAQFYIPLKLQLKHRRRYTYTCVNCHQLYVRKIKMNVEKYCCSKCLGKLKLVE